MQAGGVWLIGTASLMLSALAGAQTVGRPACVTVVDMAATHGIRGARVRAASGDTLNPGTIITPPTGRACFVGSETAQVRIDAVGYYPVWVALATRAAPAVRLEPMAPGVMLPEWGSAQIGAGLEQILRRPEMARDTTAASSLTEILRRLDRLTLDMRLSGDSVGAPLVGYTELASDGSRYAELRIRHADRSIALGVTTMHCGERCVRERDIVVSWQASDGSNVWAPAFVATREGDGVVVQSSFDATLPDTVPPVRPSPGGQTAVATFVRGVVRNRQGQALAGIEVFTADGSASTTSDARGAYRLAITIPPNGTLVTTRRLGWAPEFRKVLREEGNTIEWSPELESTAVLATQLVRATGLPDELRSFRYNDLLVRRSKGIGQFFIGEEIWSAVSIGDVINRARGIRARFTHGSNLSGFVVPSCPPTAGAVGVFINGIDETGLSTLQRLDVGAQTVSIAGSTNPAAQALSNYVTSAIIGIEIFIGRTQLPAEFGDPRYCAVISLWTR